VNRPGFRAVLFDLDGTIVDSSADLAASVNHARAALGLGPLALEAVRGMIGDGMPVLLARAFAEAPALVPRAIDLFKAHYGAHLCDHTRAYPGVERALVALSGRARAIVTNKPEAFSREILSRLGLDAFFGAVVGGDSGHGRKPEPGPFRAALAALGGGLRPEDALVVGDGRNDVLGGRAAGLAVCAVGFGLGDREELRALGPDYWIESWPELPALVAAPPEPLPRPTSTSPPSTRTG
jgi:phosphoglycolate phosphatase